MSEGGGIRIDAAESARRIEVQEPALPIRRLDIAALVRSLRRKRIAVS